MIYIFKTVALEDEGLMDFLNSKFQSFLQGISQRKPEIQFKCGSVP